MWVSSYVDIELRVNILETMLSSFVGNGFLFRSWSSLLRYEKHDTIMFFKPTILHSYTHKKFHSVSWNLAFEQWIARAKEHSNLKCTLTMLTMNVGPACVIYSKREHARTRSNIKNLHFYLCEIMYTNLNWVIRTETHRLFSQGMETRKQKKNKNEACTPLPTPCWRRGWMSDAPLARPMHNAYIYTHTRTNSRAQEDSQRQHNKV